MEIPGPSGRVPFGPGCLLAGRRPRKLGLRPDQNQLARIARGMVAGIIRRRVGLGCASDWWAVASRFTPRRTGPLPPTPAQRPTAHRHFGLLVLRFDPCSGSSRKQSTSFFQDFLARVRPHGRRARTPRQSMAQTYAKVKSQDLTPIRKPPSSVQVVGAGDFHGPQTGQVGSPLLDIE